jgi:hypothetical protein
MLKSLNSLSRKNYSIHPDETIMQILSFHLIRKNVNSTFFPITKIKCHEILNFYFQLNPTKYFFDVIHI